MFRSILIVEDSPQLRQSLSAALSDRAAVVFTCGSVEEVRRVLTRQSPDLILLDFDLPDGNAFDVLRELRADAPAPVVVVTSRVAGPGEAFQLAELGVRAYLTKPFGFDELLEVLTIAGRPPDIAPFVRGMVGHASIAAVERRVRTLMVTEALARAHGSRSGAAKLLAISRQMLQHILRRDPKA
jgi:two-component system, response regulator RegA